MYYKEASLRKYRDRTKDIEAAQVPKEARVYQVTWGYTTWSLDWSDPPGHRFLSHPRREDRHPNTFTCTIKSIVNENAKCELIVII